MVSKQFYIGEWFEFKVVTFPNGRCPFGDFTQSFSPRELRDLEISLRIVDESFDIGRPEAGPLGRYSKIRGVRESLYELVITPRHSRRGRKLRGFFIIEDRKVWLIDGFTKTSPRVANHIQRAIKILRQWRASRESKADEQ